MNSCGISAQIHISIQQKEWLGILDPGKTCGDHLNSGNLAARSCCSIPGVTLKIWNFPHCWEFFGITAGSISRRWMQERTPHIQHSWLLQDCQGLLDCSWIHSWHLWNRIHLGFGCKTFHLMEKNECELREELDQSLGSSLPANEWELCWSFLWECALGTAPKVSNPFCCSPVLLPCAAGMENPGAQPHIPGFPRFPSSCTHCLLS